MTFFFGALIGLVSFWLAMATVQVPKVDDFESFSYHDLALAINLAYIFPPLIGFWTGFCRRSLWWIFVGMSVAPVLGWIYKALCGGTFNMLLIITAAPALLGGVAAVALGFGRNSWWDRVQERLVRGLLSGLVLGIVYEIVLNVVCGVLHLMAPPGLATLTYDHFRLMMWIAGSVAMAAGGGVFMPLFHWSANVPRPHFAILRKPTKAQ